MAEQGVNVPNAETPAEPREADEAGHADGFRPSDRSRRAKVRKWIWISAALLVVLVAGILLILLAKKRRDLKSKEASAKPPAAAVTVGQSKTGDINIYVTALGTVTPIYTVTVFSQVTGKVVGV